MPAQSMRLGLRQRKGATGVLTTRGTCSRTHDRGRYMAVSREAVAVAAAAEVTAAAAAAAAAAAVAEAAAAAAVAGARAAGSF